MGLILAIETATTNCSVALFKDGVLISDKEHDFFSQDKGISLSNPLNKNMQYIRDPTC